MKKITIFLNLLICAPLLATTQMVGDVEVNINDFWMGEYPGPGVKVVKETTLKAKKSILNDGESLINCTISSGTYHPWARKTEAKFASTTVVQKVRALKDSRFEVYGNKIDERTGNYEIIGSIFLRKGQIIDQLTYLSEGFCKFRSWSGTTFDDDCADFGENFETVHPFSQELEERFGGQYFATQCKEGEEAWITVDNKLFDNESIEEAIIDDYGTISE